MGPCFRMLSQGRRERMQLSNGCPVIASASEAIHLCRKESMDCFVAYAPRNDVALIPHTPSSYATTSLVRPLSNRSRIQRTRPAIASRAKRCRVHRIPPRVRDDRDTPLWWGGMRKVVEMIWGCWKQEYFCKGGWTENSLTG